MCTVGRQRVAFQLKQYQKMAALSLAPALIVSRDRPQVSMPLPLMLMTVQ